jgi:hypothetical protein
MTRDRSGHPALNGTPHAGGAAARQQRLLAGRDVRLLPVPGLAALQRTRVAPAGVSTWLLRGPGAGRRRGRGP